MTEVHVLFRALGRIVFFLTLIAVFESWVISAEKQLRLQMGLFFSSYLTNLPSKEEKGKQK